MTDTFFLSDTYLLRGATIGDVESVQGVCEEIQYEAGDVIVSDREHAQDIMIVVSGRCRVETREGDLIDEPRQGAMVGEIAFLDGKPRTANVYASGPCKVVFIPAEKLRDLMKANQSLEVVILRNAALALCQRLRDANQQIESLLVPR